MLLLLEFSWTLFLKLVQTVVQPHVFMPTFDTMQLPRMLRTDAIARYYGLEKGQVVKVTYDGDMTRAHITYRCVW